MRMMSGMTKSSMSPVRNPQCPPSTSLFDPHFLHTSEDIFHKIKIIIFYIKDNPVLHVSEQKPPCSPSMVSWPPFSYRLLIKISLGQVVWGMVVWVVGLGLDTEVTSRLDKWVRVVELGCVWVWGWCWWGSASTNVVGEVILREHMYWLAPSNP